MIEATISTASRWHLASLAVVGTQCHPEGRPLNMILHSQGTGSTEPSLNDDGGSVNDDAPVGVMPLDRLCSYSLLAGLTGPMNLITRARTLTSTWPKLPSGKVFLFPSLESKAHSNSLAQILDVASPPVRTNAKTILLRVRNAHGVRSCSRPLPFGPLATPWKAHLVSHGFCYARPETPPSQTPASGKREPFHLSLRT